MSRWEFMRQLEELLSDIAPAEREEALQYYNDYFNDAGRENEQEVIQALGTPAQVASIVKEGLNGNTGEFTESGFQSSTTAKEECGTYYGNTGTDSSTYQEKTEEKKSFSQSFKELPTWAMVLIIIALVIFSPAIFSIIITVLSGIFGILITMASLVLAFAITTIVLFIVAIALVIAGFAKILVSPISSIGLIGSGFICAAIGLLFLVLLVVLGGKGIPALCKGISSLWNQLFGKKGGAQA